jgi:hypothetical protein
MGNCVMIWLAARSRRRRRQTMTRLAHKDAYPGIAFRPRTLNWWARLTQVPAECVHLDHDAPWMATLSPDTLYLRGKAARHREPRRPEVSLCRACLVGALETDLAAFPGRVVAFEPDPESFTQYFFLATPDFDAAGLLPDVASATERRLARPAEACEDCGHAAKWLWFSHAEVPSLDEVGSIATSPGLHLCARHGARRLCASLESIAEANLLYINLPYGDAGAYVWI